MSGQTLFASDIFSPFQGFLFLGDGHYPGRCPGLYYFAPSGLFSCGMAWPWFFNRNYESQVSRWLVCSAKIAFGELATGVAQYFTAT